MAEGEARHVSWTQQIKELVAKLDLAAKMNASVVLDTYSCAGLSQTLRIMAATLDVSNRDMSVEEYAELARQLVADAKERKK